MAKGVKGGKEVKKVPSAKAKGEKILRGKGSKGADGAPPAKKLNIRAAAKKGRATAVSAASTSKEKRVEGGTKGKKAPSAKAKKEKIEDVIDGSEDKQVEANDEQGCSESVREEGEKEEDGAPLAKKSKSCTATEKGTVADASATSTSKKDGKRGFCVFL